MLPLAINACGGVRGAFSGLPSGFLHPVNGPYGWVYVLGFGVVMIVSYNASWSLAQKYYSVRDEKEAEKAAYFSAFLNAVGAPLMILPAILGHHFLPDLVAQHRTVDTYVLLVIRLLPAGMVGIIIAAMFSATMAAVSADFNAIAAVLTQDIYCRLIRPAAKASHLLLVGRWITFGLGALTTLLSLCIALTHQESIFNLMVTVLGLFMAPTLLPLLAGLTVKRLNWQGAFAGFLCGLITGCVMLVIKSFWPQSATLFGSSYNFEGVSLLINTAATIAGMIAGTMLWRSTSVESARTAEFFAQMEQPIRADEVPLNTGNPVAPILGVSTALVGILIAVAGLVSGSSPGRAIDLSVGFLLVCIGMLLRRDRKKVGAAVSQ
jgi:SSS family solute:Na+ symporter